MLMNILAEKMRIFAYSKAASLLLLFGFFYMVAAASHSGFMAKWALIDEDSNFSFISLVDGTAEKPWVYRQLMPTLAKTMQPVIAESNSIFFVKLRKYFEYNIDPSASFSRATQANIDGYEYTYRIVCLANFLALLCSLFMLRQLALRSGFTSLEATLAPSAFILAFPYIQTVGGYFYDSIELAFFCGAVLLANKGRMIPLAILIVFATLNKESFFFIIPTLYPFLREKFSQKTTIVNLIILLIISGLINVYLKYIFQENSGGFVVIQLWDNLKSYITPSNYFKYETTYGLPSPSRTCIVTVVLIFIIIARGWHNITPVWKQHIQIAAIINIPLFIVFCAFGELRNLSIIFVGFVILIAAAIKITAGASLKIK
jgi:hypothetical protein